MLDKLKKGLGFGEQRAPRDVDTLWTTPVAWKDEEGTYYGHNGQVWLYRALPIDPLEWEDGQKRLQLGQRLTNLLVSVGSTSSVPVGGLRQLSNNREIHILSISWEEGAKPPRGTEERLAEYQREVFNFTVPKRALILGIRLRPTTKNKSQSSLNQLASMATKVLAEDVPDRAAYNADREAMSSLIARVGGSKGLMSKDQQSQIESWYNLGRGPDVSIVEESTSLRVSNFDTIEMSAIMRFGNPVMQAPNSQWVLDTLTHPDGPRVVSVRAELEPSVVTRGRARRAIRKVQASIAEEAATGDLERVELSQTSQQVAEFERFTANSKEPILSNCSILMARSISDYDESYIDFLNENYGIEIKPLEHRQIRALDETLPCSTRRINPFLQDISISMLSYAGLNGFANLGDSKGPFLGLSHPDMTLTHLDIEAAPNANRPPAMLVTGDPGSGKTFVCQHLAYQAVLEGKNVIFINPKGFDSLESFAETVNGRVIKMSALEGEPGAFDPFLYAPPEIAAEIATDHILSVLGRRDGFTQAQRLAVGDALRKAARIGARCVADAFQFIDDDVIVEQIMQQVRGSSLFALGVALGPREAYKQQNGLTLIEFDRALRLPEPSTSVADYGDAEVIALAALRLIIQASMEILSHSQGGMMVVDEAWTFLGQPTGAAALQRIGREGRSLNLLPVFATQRVSDAISKDLEGYISRVLVMQMQDETEVRASLKLCGVAATADRVKWVQSCGYDKGDPENGIPARLPMGLHRDVMGRHSAVLLGPTPERIRLAFTTNPEERRNREEAKNLAKTLEGAQ